jgi:hypothetical protein
MKAAPAYVVDLNVYELDGETRSFIDDPSYNYYMLTYLVPKGSGKSRANAQAWSMKQVTPETVKASAELFRTLWEKGYRGTAAGAGAVQANADLYEQILNPFSAVDAGSVTLADVAEDREDYEAIRIVYENGLMSLTGENTFSPDDPATAGDLIGALHLLAFGAPAASAEEAAATFTQYGLVPAGVAAGDALTYGLRNQIMSAFGGAVGIPLPAIGEDQADEVMTRGQLAQDLTIFNDGNE